MYTDCAKRATRCNRGPAVVLPAGACPARAACAPAAPLAGTAWGHLLARPHAPCAAPSCNKRAKAHYVARHQIDRVPSEGGHSITCLPYTSINPQEGGITTQYSVIFKVAETIQSNKIILLKLS